MKLGVIGLGSWGRRVATEYIALAKEGKLDSVYLYDIEKSRMNEFKNDSNAVLCGDANQMIKSVEGVHVCVPNESHYEVAQNVLKHEVSSLIEKPITLNRNDAYKLIELAEENGVGLQVGHIYRFSNVIRKWRELHNNKDFGEVYNVNFYWTHLMPYFENMDILWDLLPHPIDMFQFVTKSWPEKFTGMGRAFRRPELNEVASLQSVSDDGILLSFHFSWLSPIRRRQIEVIGSKRSAIIEAVTQKLTMYDEKGVAESVDVQPNNTIRDQALNFIHCIETGKNVHNSSIVGAKVVEIIEKAIQSMV